MAMDCIVDLVLDFLKEQFRGRSINIIVYGCRIDISQLLVESSLTQANLPYFGKQTLKIVLTYK